MKTISRRNFLKSVGAGTLMCTLPSCDSKNKSGNDISSSGSLEYRTNSSTKDKVSLIGFGCMRLPLLPHPDANGNPVDQEALNKIIDLAFEKKINYFDTAPVYVQRWSETAMGNALSRHPRDSYFVATKLSFMSDPTFENSVKMYHDSMKNLKVDYLDYYLLHSVGRGEDPMGLFNKRFIDNGVLDYLLEERKAGRIRNLGFSFHGDVKVFDNLLAMHDKVHWDFVQIQLNYCDWQYPNSINVKAEYLYTELEKRNISAVVMEPLLGGRLAKLPDYLVQRLKQREPDLTVASWAFRFAGSLPGVLTVLSGMQYEEHIEENVETYSPLLPLSDDDRLFLEDVAYALCVMPTIPCTDCQYCMPCPYGLDIPAIFAHYNKCVNAGDMPVNPQNDKYSKQRRAFLVGYDRSVPKLRQADHCTGCGECLDPCPQKINIPAQMKTIDRYIESLKQGNVTLQQLRDQLHEENCSLVISSNGPSAKSFNGKGVSDLYKLYTKFPKMLENAAIADKVVGKGAAVFIVLGGVKTVYTDLISEPALKLLKDNDIRVVYDKKTDMIMNNSKSDLCPVEKICKDSDDIEALVPLIGDFLKSVNLL